MTKILEEGQYVLPDNMTIERTGKYITIRQKTNFIEGNRCMDCKYFGHGQATYRGYTTTICLKQPKRKNGLYYHVGDRMSPCANFEKKEEQERKRAEQIEQAAKKYVKDIVTPLPASLMTAFIKGAEFADRTPINYDGKAMLHVLNKGHEQGWKDAIDKAYDLLIERYENQGVILLEDINEFKQIMEESK